MEYKIFRIPGKFCIGIRVPRGKGYDPFLYWNTEKQIFQEDASVNCWCDKQHENKVIADFVRIFIFKETN